jgi:hypothetical protein
MKRRTFIVGAGSFAASTGTILGSGAFTSTDANRTVDVRIADDFNAYLRLTPVDNDFAESRGDGDHLALRFDEEFSESWGDPDIDSDNTGDGLGRNSVYEFDSVFSITNQGTNKVKVFGRFDGDEVNSVEIYDTFADDQKSLTSRSRSRKLSPGDGVLRAGVRINTHNTELGLHDETLTIAAETPD